MDRKDILRREQKWNWDRRKDRETLIVRRMERDDPRLVLKDYGKEFLKEVYIRNLHYLDKVSANFWKLVLGITDEEIDRTTEKSLRFSIKIWDK